MISTFDWRFVIKDTADDLMGETRFRLCTINLNFVGGQIIQTVKYADDLVPMAKEETVLQDMIDKLTFRRRNFLLNFSTLCI